MVGNHRRRVAFQFPMTTPRCDEESKTAEAGSTIRLNGGGAGCHDTLSVRAARRRGDISLDIPFHRTGLWPGTRSAFRHQVAKLTDSFTAVDLLFPLSSRPCLVTISSRHVNSSKCRLSPSFPGGFSSNAYYRPSIPLKSALKLQVERAKATSREPITLHVCARAASRPAMRPKTVTLGRP